MPSPKNGFWERWISDFLWVTFMRCSRCKRVRSTTSEKLISGAPCPICRGSRKCSDEACSNCNGEGSIPFYEENPDYLP
jgi:hypothetical protein